jgi:hypothetical protein
VKQVSYKCVTIPGKGMGMIATRDIENGELIIQEEPVFDVRRYSRIDYLVDQFKKLSSTEQEAVMNLHNAHPEFGELHGIMNTNSLKRGDNSILCLEVSRFNHSCLPNAEYTFSEPYQRVYAIRNIKKGDELCVSYSVFEGDIESVRLELKTKYGFDCMCELCDMKDEKSPS